MKIIITGGSGFIGKILTKKFIDTGHSVTVIGRKPATGLFGAGTIAADTTKPGAWQKSILENDVIINLAGASIFTRWTKKTKTSIMDSRILTTGSIPEKKITLINAWYSHLSRYSRLNFYSENSGAFSQMDRGLSLKN